MTFTRESPEDLKVPWPIRKTDAVLQGEPHRNALQGGLKRCRPIVDPRMGNNRQELIWPSESFAPGRLQFQGLVSSRLSSARGKHWYAQWYTF
jgi:hypothetical protein